MSMQTNDDHRAIHDLLNAFQEVLNWCRDIDDDDSRLPLDLLDRAQQTINEGTVKFQPEKLLKPFDAAYREWRAAGCEGGCNGDSDVCACAVPFACGRCGRRIVATGEDMPAYAAAGGRCQDCETASPPLETAAAAATAPPLLPAEAGWYWIENYEFGRRAGANRWTIIHIIELNADVLHLKKGDLIVGLNSLETFARARRVARFIRIAEPPSPSVPPLPPTPRSS